MVVGAHYRVDISHGNQRKNWNCRYNNNMQVPNVLKMDSTFGNFKLSIKHSSVCLSVTKLIALIVLIDLSHDYDYQE